MPSEESISSVRFRNFKAFSDFSISLDRMNILVGPNNSGKSTVIGAFRVLSMGLRKAALRNPERLFNREFAMGYRMPMASLPISLENAQTDYQNVEATVTFRLTNGNRLRLSFYTDDDCIMFPIPADGERVTKVKFKQQFPISFLVVPVLGPLEYREKLRKKETVDANLATHRASRNFRNYWHYFPDDFEAFRQQVKTTWPGMDISPPELTGEGILTMFCTEDRIARELYWTGYGFQVWCQLLSHISRSQGKSMLVIDEPDIYLHANPQRQLLSILKASDPDVILATHSSEIIAEAEANDILAIDKTQRSARRVRSAEGIRSALGELGSTQMVTMTTIAQTRRVLFVEGDDFKILRRFAKRLGLNELAAGVGIAPFPLGGFPTPQRIKAVCLGISESIGGDLLFGGIFDRDYRSNEEVIQLANSFSSELSLCKILDRKEIENFLLLPNALDRTLGRLLKEKSRRAGVAAAICRSARDLLQEITDPMKIDVQAQFIAKRADYYAHSGRDASTISKEAIEIFDQEWNDDQLRLQIVPGKKVFRKLCSLIQSEFKVNLTAARVIGQLRQGEIPWELDQTLRAIESFRNRTP